MEIAYKVMNVDELLENVDNPRVISPVNRQGLKNSIERFGLVQPIIYNQITKRIVGGNQRLSILKSNGIKETTVVVVNLNENDEKALNLALNNQGIQGEFTENVLAIIDEIKKRDMELYDNLRLFEVEKIKIVEEIAKANEKVMPEMDLMPFEHYDYVVIMSDNVQDWYWLQELFGLTKVNVSPVKSKIGIGRAIRINKLREVLENYRKLQDSNTKQEESKAT